MEIRTLEHLAVTDIEDMRARIETLESENAALQKERDEWRELWNFNFKECKRLVDLCEKQQVELDRSIAQLAELTEQYGQLARKYNALTHENSSLVKDFEPVMESEDGN